MTVRVEGESEEVDVALDWAGGFVSRHRLVRPVVRYEQLSNYPLLRARIDTLHRQGSRYSEIARCLNAEGFRPPKRTTQFTTAMVARFLGSQGLHGTRPRAMSDAQLLQEHEYWLTDLARQLNIPVATLHKWQRVGWIQSRKVPVAGGRWAIWADADESAPSPPASLPPSVARAPLSGSLDDTQAPCQQCVEKPRVHYSVHHSKGTRLRRQYVW